MPTTRLSLLRTSSDGHNQVNVASAELCELCELPICVALLRVVCWSFCTAEAITHEIVVNCSSNVVTVFHRSCSTV